MLELLRDAGSIPELGQSPQGGHGIPLQYCLENPMDRGAFWVHGVAESDMTEAKQARGKLSSKVLVGFFHLEVGIDSSCSG